MHSEVAKNLDQSGWLYTQQKNYGAALRCYERSVFIWTKALGSGSPELASKYQKLAEVYAALNRPVDAEPLVRSAFHARERDCDELEYVGIHLHRERKPGRSGAALSPVHRDSG